MRGQVTEVVSMLNNKRKKIEKKKTGTRKEKKIPTQPKPKNGKYWYDPDCGPIYKD
jgi:hypothetical protein